MMKKKKKFFSATPSNFPSNPYIDPPHFSNFMHKNPRNFLLSLRNSFSPFFFRKPLSNKKFPTILFPFLISLFLVTS